MASSTQHLSSHKIRSTEIRIAVLDLFLQNKQALSKQDIETNLPKQDRITLYRTLKTFEDKGLIHKVFNSSNKVKYALCSDSCGHEAHNDQHIHFECTDCKQTTCIDSVPLPQISLPKEYLIQKLELTVTGLCNNCK